LPIDFRYDSNQRFDAAYSTVLVWKARILE